MSFEDNAGSANFIPNKDNPNFTTKWPKKSLNLLYNYCMEHVPTEAPFEKLSNPLLNGLKTFSSNHEVFCPKCKAEVKLSKNGRTKDTYQFVCNNGEREHYNSATQILETIPDDWMVDFVEVFDSSYRTQLLNWINKEHLSPEIWETKGLKNATKRFATELSPLKQGDMKIRIVNSSLEQEVKDLKLMVQQLVLKQVFYEEENSKLNKALKAAIEEADMLRKFMLEKAEDKEGVKKSFAAVANIFKPKPKIMKSKLKPIEVISKMTDISKFNNEAKTEEKQFVFSPLKIIYFEGCQRRSPAVYRQMFRDVGIENRSVRDITFLAEDILQITTYESSIGNITDTLESISPDVHRIINFDPCKAASYSKYGKFSDAEVKASYFALMTKSAERMTKAAENVKSLKRTAAFMNKVVELKNTSYEITIRKPKCFVLGDFIQIPTTIEPCIDLTNLSESVCGNNVAEMDISDVKNIDESAQN